MWLSKRLSKRVERLVSLARDSFYKYGALKQVGIQHTQMSDPSFRPLLQGVLGLWRGTGPTVLRVGLGAGLYFLMLDRVMTGMRTLHETRQQAAHDAALEKSALESSSPADQDLRLDSVEVLVSPRQEVREIEQLVQAEPSTSGQKGGTEGRQAGKRADAGGGLPALYTMTAGAVTRSTAAALLCPVTVVKTRMEVRGWEEARKVVA